MDVDRPRIPDLVDAPDAIKELPSAEGAARMCGEHREQLEFLRPQVDRATGSSQLVSGQVELQTVRDVDDGLAGPGSLLQEGRSVRQFLRVDGQGEGLIEPLPKGIEALGRVAWGTQVDGPKACPPTTLPSHQLDVAILGRRRCHDRDSGAAVTEERQERPGIVHGPDASGRWPSTGDFEGRAVGGEDEPGGPSAPCVDSCTARHRQRNLGWRE